jgi:hypothetical protein
LAASMACMIIIHVSNRKQSARIGQVPCPSEVGSPSMARTLASCLNQDRYAGRLRSAR